MTPIFATPWILTWFSHNFSDFKKIQRIFDFLLSSRPITIIYLCSAVNYFS